MSGKKPKLFVREWKLVPSEWREATPEEVEEFERKFGRKLDELFGDWIEGTKMTMTIVEELERFARFVRKMREAFEELER